MFEIKVRKRQVEAMGREHKRGGWYFTKPINGKANFILGTIAKLFLLVSQSFAILPFWSEIDLGGPQ